MVRPPSPGPIPLGRRPEVLREEELRSLLEKAALQPVKENDKAQWGIDLLATQKTRAQVETVPAACVHETRGSESIPLR